MFSSALGELGPGRLMYDGAHWKSELTVLFSARAARSDRAVGGWPGAPDYSQLPPELAEHSVLTDPLPPLRANLSWPASYGAEYLTKPNSIIEFDPPDPNVGRAYSALDTLYETLGGPSGSGHPYDALPAPMTTCSSSPASRSGTSRARTRSRSWISCFRTSGASRAVPCPDRRSSGSAGFNGASC